ncbi:hypothetical protein WA158_008040 [Blastocystis sp. Blastoise]
MTEDEILSRCKTVKELLDEKPNHCLSLGCPELDKLLGGGIQRNKITEITGESSAGKTQLTLQLCLQCLLSEQKGGLNGIPIYLSSEGIFPSDRLAEMANEFIMENKEFTNSNVTDNILVKRINSFDQLISSINSIPPLLEKKPVRLVILDSLTALFRGEEMYKNASKQKQQALIQLFTLLRSYCQQYDLTFIIINQVSNVFTTDSSSSPSPSLYEYGHPIKPALGSIVPSFSLFYYVYFYMLCRRKSSYPEGVPVDIIIKDESMGLSDDIVRDMYILVSASRPVSKRSFIITQRGIRDIPN